MERKSSIGTGGALCALAAMAWVAGCVPQAPEETGGAGAGGSAAVGTGGARPMGTGGLPPSGAGGTTPPAGTGGGSVAGTGGTVAGTGGANPSNPPAGDAGGTTPDTGSTADAAYPAAAGPGYATCVVCHGADGAGNDKGPDIRHPVKDYATFVVRNGRTHPNFMMPMPKYTTAMLPDDQMQMIFTWLSSLPKPTTGADLYKDFCQNCHGADGRGGVTMRPIFDKPVTKFLMDTRAGHHPGEFANRREYMPKWTAAELTDAEIRLIFMHVDAL